MQPSLVNYKDLLIIKKKPKLKVITKTNTIPKQLNKFEGTSTFFINITALILISIGIYYLYKRKSDKSQNKEKHLKNIEKLRKLSENI
tara:strand:+ start:758 stop:1021 length:264 start_codon:yes stop_codon:yes gene_type:complete